MSDEKPMMGIEEAVRLLRQHNGWRRYTADDGRGPKMVDPTLLGQAMDCILFFHSTRLPNIRAMLAVWERENTEMSLSESQSDIDRARSLGAAQMCRTVLSWMNSLMDVDDGKGR